MIHSTRTTITPMTIQVTAVEDMKGSSEGYRGRQSMARQRRREAAHVRAERQSAQIVALNGAARPGATRRSWQ
jgi:23S rRNA maturation-related 3'-5' exoribonuclease YhaM